MTEYTKVSDLGLYKDWYNPDITSVNDYMRTILEQYSKIEPDKVVDHINDIRAQGFQVMPYPCIGQYRFTVLILRSLPLYPRILERMKSSPSSRYVDLGCCFGQDLRQLVCDGVPSSQLTGIDIKLPLIELGYDLFRDRDTLKSRFLIADILAEPTKDDVWTELAAEGVDVVHASAIFHLFPRPEQVAAAINVARFVRPRGVIVGRQVGNVNAKETNAARFGFTAFRHNIQSWRELWEEVGKKTGTKWEVEGTMSEIASQVSAIEDHDTRMMLFSVERVE